MAITKVKHIDIYLGGYNVSHKKVLYVTLDKTKLSMIVGDTVHLNYEVYPANAYYDEVEWRTSNENAVIVDEDGNVTAVGEGKSIVTVKIGRKTYNCEVVVKRVINFQDPLVKKILVRNYDTDGDGEISYFEASKVKSIPFPMFTGMPISYFNELKYFTNVKTIGNNAFDSCTKLKEIEFPPGLEKINKSAFSNCDSLTTITIPKSVNSIGSYAFANCDKFITAYINSNVPAKNGTEIFANCPSLDSIVVPSEFMNDYLDAINWGMRDEENILYYAYIIIECFDYTFDFFLS